MEFKCKICAGSLTIEPKSRIAVCDYCGTKQTLPMFGDESSKVLYERGNAYLLHNEYDKAENIFNQLLSVNSNDAELFWDLVLCKYGVTYAKDPKTEKYIPTCNRTHTESVFKNENYLKAIELSTDEKAEIYKNDAAIIDNIQKGILELSRKEKPFDIFISYKETDPEGYRTKDSIEAQKLYEKLTALGYKVFFSRITLESKVGEEYEPIIYAALSSSKVMITVCSSPENIQSAWVKNEWSRFLTLRRGEMSKTLIPVYFDMEESELPEEFALLSAQNMKAPDFEQELIRGIKKLIPTPIIKKEYRKKMKKVLAIASAIVVIVGVPVVFLAIKPARIEAKNREQYELAMGQFNNGEYDSAKQLFEELEGYEDSADMSLKCTYTQAMSLFDNEEFDLAKSKFDELGDYADSSEMAIKCTYYADYLNAMELYYDHNYPEATWAFAAIGDYDEVNEMKEKCAGAWRESVADIATDVNLRNTQRCSYYVTANGTVNPFEFNKGNANVAIETNSSGEKISEMDLGLNEHGGVVSIASNDVLYALYEDGFVCNSAFNNKMEMDWDEAIQVSDVFNVTNIALLANGKVVYGNTNDTVMLDSNACEAMDVNDKWLEEVDDWADIVEIDWAADRELNSGALWCGVLVGIDNKGCVHAVMTNIVPDDLWETSAWSDALSFIKDLDDIKRIKINCIEYEVGTGYGTGLCVTAIDSNNTLHIFTPNGESVQEIGEIKDFCIGSDGETYVIDSKNSLMKIGDDKSIIEGAVYLNDGFCVTQSGTIFQLDGSSTECKTELSDTWLER